MPNNCGTCKHWEARNATTPQGEKVYAECGLIGDEYGIEAQMEGITDQAYTQAGEVANTSLITASSFGCILWEAEDGK